MGFISIAILAAIIVTVYGCSSTPVKTSKIKLRSEEDILSGTMANVEKHLNDKGTVRAKQKEIVKEEQVTPQPAVAVEEPAIIETPDKND